MFRNQSCFLIFMFPSSLYSPGLLFAIFNSLLHSAGWFLNIIIVLYLMKAYRKIQVIERIPTFHLSTSEPLVLLVYHLYICD